MRAAPSLLLSLLLVQAMPLSQASAISRSEQQDVEKNKAPRGHGPDAPRSRHRSVVRTHRAAEPSFLSGRSLSTLNAGSLAEASPRSLPEALWDSPGVFVQQTNHGGGSPIVRGMIGPQVLLLVDGVRFSNSVYRTGPVQYLNLIDPLSLGSLRVLRGPGSVLFGSDAMGGVIHAQTHGLPHAGPDDLDGGARFLYRYGSANHGRILHGRVDTAVGRSSFMGGVSLRKLGDLEAGGSVGTQPHSGYEQWSALGKASYSLPGGSFVAGYLFSGIEGAGRTDKLADKGSLQIYDNDDHLAYGRLNLRMSPLSTTARLTLSYQHFFERKDNHKMAMPDLETRLGTTRDEVTAGTLGAELRLTTSLLDEELRLRYGGMWYRDQVGAKRSGRGAEGGWLSSEEKSYPEGSTYESYGAFLVAESDLLRLDSEHLLIGSAGYRFQGMAGHAPSASGLPGVNFEHQGHVLQAGIEYSMDEWAGLALSYSQGFRSPNLQEAVMLGDTGKFFHVPNPRLEPEEIESLELTARMRLSWLRLRWAGFVSRLSNLIGREGTFWGHEEYEYIDGKEVVHNVNAGEGLLWGTEGELFLWLSSELSLFGQLSHIWGEEQVEDGPDRPLTRIPPLFGTAGLRLDSGQGDGSGAYLEAFVRAAARQDRLSDEDEKDVRIPERGTPGWWTANLRAGIWLLDSLRVTLSLDNLLDSEYKYHGSGICAAGRSAVFTADLRF